jgi:hypothetical protein
MLKIMVCALTYALTVLLASIAVAQSPTQSAESPDQNLQPPSSMIRAGEKDYDPLSTLLALNNCITSISKIKTYNDRIILNQEYDNIINNINYETLEPDTKLKDLFMEMMTYIVGCKLREGEKDRLLKSYNKNVKRALVESFSGFSIQGLNPASMIVSGVTSLGGAYLNYQNSLEKYQDDLDSKMWILEKEKQTDLNDLQKSLFDASWTLIQKYKIKDKYSLRQDNIEDFIDIIKTDKDPLIAQRRLKSLMERMSAYPPYWYYYGIFSKSAGLNEEALNAFRNFELVSRNIFRKDPYYPSVCMNKISLLNSSRDQAEIYDCLNKIDANSGREDWTNYFFIAMQYCLMDDFESASNYIQKNLDNKKEIELNTKIMQGITSRSLSKEIINNQIMVLILNDDTFKNQDLLNLYGKAKDEVILNRIFGEAKNIELNALRKLGRDDNLTIVLPQKWLMGSLGYVQDNIFENNSDNFSLQVYQKSRAIVSFSRDDIILPSDTSNDTKKQIDELKEILKNFDNNDKKQPSNASQLDINDLSKSFQDKLSNKKKIQDKINVLDSRQRNLKFRKIEYNSAFKAFNLIYRGEMDNIEKDPVSVIIRHQSDKLELIFKQDSSASVDLYTSKNFRYIVDHLYFNGKRFLITSNGIVEG